MVNAPLTSRQTLATLATLALWLAAVIPWLLFSPGVFWILDTIANGSFK